MIKHEQTVLRALRDGWYIEEIEELTGKDSFSIFRLARRHGLNARHAPTRPNYMRARAIAHSVESVGDIQTSIGISHLFVDRVGSCEALSRDGAAEESENSDINSHKD